MRSNFNKLSRPEVDFLIDNCNFTDDEMLLLKMASGGYSDIQISEKLSVTTSMITKRKRAIKEKIINFLGVLEYMTTIYIGGKRVTKEELAKTEIKLESVKRILSDKLLTPKK
uniref:HTH luxR-type domain-containing protein n=1 Tax=Dulem virus 39 TaxID=3145757 RepID=A0AAU8B7J9_9CAUD